jgi:hypothetical protein
MTDEALNEAVAISVMGWRRLERPGFIQKDIWDSYKWPILSAPGAGYKECIPDFANPDGSKFLQVIDTMKEMGWLVRMTNSKTGVRATFILKNREKECTALDPKSLPHAVCRAALEAMKYLKAKA